jgi:serine/threonine protein kinase
LAAHAGYEIKKELGRGGMGVVYLARNTLMGRDEVLKVMGPRLTERPELLDRFLREIRAVARLRHPNIVTAYHATRLGESLVFAMEYVEGLDLSKMVKAKGPFPVGHACYLIHQAALGLQHAHEEGMVHRDIKPGNLMLSRKGNRAIVKVLDFGLAKATREGSVDGELTGVGQMLGTPAFMAPEQFRDAQQADIRADIYSLGCTLFYLLTGNPPFQGTGLYDLFQAHHSMDAPTLNLVLPEVPAELGALVAKMMAKEPGRRFQSPAEVAQALTPFFKKGNTAFQSSRPDLSRAARADSARATGDTGSVSTEPSGDNAPELALQGSAEVPQPEPMWASLIDFRELDRSTEVVKPEEEESAGSPRRPPWMTWLMIAAASLFGLIALGIIITITTDKGRTKITVDEKTGDVQVEHESAGGGETIRKEAVDGTLRDVDEVGRPVVVYDDSLHEFIPGNPMPGGEGVTVQTDISDAPDPANRFIRLRYEPRKQDWVRVPFLLDNTFNPARRFNLHRALAATKGDPIVLRFHARSASPAVVGFAVGGAENDSLVIRTDFIHIYTGWTKVEIDLSDEDLSSVHGALIVHIDRAHNADTDGPITLDLARIYFTKLRKRPETE